ncbi:hypothetical protein [Pelagicoccus sp. SDUM812002]|uniref:hypothetical protein n=1 Tax=Pelagicoccus sp. SDUM812002 TaxID=3041266 RepID=UPI00280CDDE1|nr:hypothetical protein [Pelagicoccus sp. SDUM812002]MDQ8184276.1 hypothetical protein [Pelagicoccus sp. SDUM812002]
MVVALSRQLPPNSTPPADAEIFDLSVPFRSAVRVGYPSFLLVPLAQPLPMRRFQISGKPSTGLAYRIVRGFASCFAGTWHQQPRAAATETARSISLRSLRRQRLLAQLAINTLRGRPFAELAAATVYASFLSYAYSCSYHSSAGSKLPSSFA